MDYPQFLRRNLNYYISEDRTLEENDRKIIYKLYEDFHTTASSREKIVETLLEHFFRTNDISLLVDLHHKYNRRNRYKFYFGEDEAALSRIKSKFSKVEELLSNIIKGKDDQALYVYYESLFRGKIHNPPSNAECRKTYLWSSAKYPDCHLHERLASFINSPDVIDVALLLSFEARSILSQYDQVNYESSPERDEAIKSLKAKDRYDNYVRCLKYIDKLLKADKAILALYLMTNYCAWDTMGDAKLLADTYIKAFVILKRYDLLEKYYETLDILNTNLAFLQEMAQYFVANNNAEKARETLEKIKAIEPQYGYIEQASKQIERISLIEHMLSKNIDMENIDQLSGQAFEDLLIRQFEQMGYSVESTPASGDYGADIIVEDKDETRYIIQCKRFKSRVNLKAVQEVVAALAHFNGDIGIVVTNSSFLNSAIKLAKSNDIELWGSNELMKFLSGDLSFSQI